MKTENWIVAFGAGILFAVLLVALLPDDLWDDEAHHAAQAVGNAVGVMPGDARGGRRITELPAAAPGFSRQPNYPPQLRGRAVAMPAGRGLVPFSAARTEAFNGTVAQVQGSGVDQGWGQIHVWIADRNGDAMELSMAPDWYLEYMGCGVTRNMYVKGTGFIFDTDGMAQPLLYAKDVTVNGVKCKLRNDEGFALWSNRLR